MTHFEIHFEDGTVDTLEGITTLAEAKAVTRQIRKRSLGSVRLFRVSEVDVDAPPRTRGNSSNEGTVTVELDG